MSEEYVTRHTLLAKARANDETAWEEFVDIYRNFIYHILDTMCPENTEIDDMAQVILLNLWKSLPQYDPNKARFRTWLGTIIRNNVVSFLRKRRTRSNHESSLLGEYDDIEDAAVQSELERKIEEEWKLHISTVALNSIHKQFPGKAMSVFEQSLQGRSPDQISADLNIKRDSVKVLKSRVQTRYLREVKRLINKLEEY